MSFIKALGVAALGVLGVCGFMFLVVSTLRAFDDPGTKHWKVIVSIALWILFVGTVIFISNRPAQ